VHKHWAVFTSVKMHQNVHRLTVADSLRAAVLPDVYWHSLVDSLKLRVLKNPAVSSNNPTEFDLVLS